MKTESKYEAVNGEVVELIRKMREEVDPKKMEAFDRACVRKLEEMRAEIAPPDWNGVGSR